MKTVIHFKIDKEIIENAKEAAATLGLSLTDVLNAALKNLIRTRTIVISDAPRMTPELEELLGPIEEDIKHGRNLSPSFKTAEEIDKYLDSL